MPSKTSSSVAASEMEDTLLRLFSSMGFDVKAVELSPKGVLHLKVTSSGSRIKESVLFAFFPKKKVGVGDVRRLRQRMVDENLQRIVLISVAGFTKAASSESAEFGLELWDDKKFNSLLAEHGLAEKTRLDSGGRVVVYDRAFVFGRDQASARKYFESKRDKGFFGFGKPAESVESVSGRFEPVAVFRVKRTEDVRRGGGVHEKKMEKAGVFYVSLTSLKTYFVDEGFMNGRPSIRDSEFLAKSVDLPQKSRLLFGDVLSKGRVSFTELGDELAVYVSRNMSKAYELQSRGLVSIQHTNDFVFFSNVNIPSFGNRRFDLGKYLRGRARLESEYPADEIKFDVERVSELISGVFSAEVEFDSVTYLPYYHCKYVDLKGGYRFDRITAVGFAETG